MDMFVVSICCKGETLEVDLSTGLQHVVETGSREMDYKRLIYAYI